MDVLDFVLECFVLLVGLRAEHLLLQFGDLLLVNLNLAFEPFAVFLIGRESGAIRFQLPVVGLKRLLDRRDVLRQRGHFFFERRYLLV